MSDKLDMTADELLHLADTHAVHVQRLSARGALDEAGTQLWEAISCVVLAGERAEGDEQHEQVRIFRALLQRQVARLEAQR